MAVVLQGRNSDVARKVLLLSALKKDRVIIDCLKEYNGLSQKTTSLKKISGQQEHCMMTTTTYSTCKRKGNLLDQVVTSIQGNLGYSSKSTRSLILLQRTSKFLCAMRTQQRAEKNRKKREPIFFEFYYRFALQYTAASTILLANSYILWTTTCKCVYVYLTNRFTTAAA